MRGMASGTPGMAVTERLSVEAQANAHETFDHRGSLFVNRARRGVDLEALSKQRKDCRGPQLQEGPAEELLSHAQLTESRPPEVITRALGYGRVDGRME